MTQQDNIRITRVLIPDTEAVFDGNTMFSDDDIADFLTAANNSVLRAAGYANLSIASSEALISKVIKTQDLSTNGAAVANALVLKANALFERADKADLIGVNEIFQIVNQPNWINRPYELTEWDITGFPYGFLPYGFPYEP